MDLVRLRQTLGKPELAWLVQRIRRRLERGEGLQGSVTLRGPTNEQRAATDRLLGRPPSAGTTLTVQLQRLDFLLRHAELCAGLKEAVEALTGPVEDQRAREALLEEKWSSLFDEAEQSCSSREAKNWLRELRETGLVRRLSRRNVETARRYLQFALEVIARLPANGVPLGELSAEATGDSHSLDVGRPLGTLTVRAAGLLGGVESWDGAEARRDAWASVGVLCDELSAPVLTLNLRGDLQSITGRALQLHAEAGEPYRLTVRQLLRQPPVFKAARLGPTVYVCENPTVVAAAANRLGTRSAPLICVEGQPRTAARLLLNRLAEAGVCLSYHGDFDWDGIRIANLVMSRHGAIPWRFSTDSYLAAQGGTSLKGTPVAASWDEDLLPAMVKSHRAIHEEQLLDDLLRDLAVRECIDPAPS